MKGGEKIFYPYWCSGGNQKTTLSYKNPCKKETQKG